MVVKNRRAPFIFKILLPSPKNCPWADRAWFSEYALIKSLSKMLCIAGQSRAPRLESENGSYDFEVRRFCARRQNTTNTRTRARAGAWAGPSRASLGRAGGGAFGPGGPNWPTSGGLVLRLPKTISGKSQKCSRWECVLECKVCHLKSLSCDRSLMY